MHGAREVIASGAVHLVEQITALEEAVEKNPGLVFDLAKTILESACIWVLKERGADYETGWDLPRLLKKTVIRLRLVPEGLDAEPEVSNSLRKTVGGLQTVIHGICELRNSYGFASHGRDASFQQLEAIQALLVARSTDAIVSFLFRVHRGYAADVGAQLPAYGDHPDFNEYVDEGNEAVQIFELKYSPSRVLFDVDPQAYRDLLAGWEEDTGSENERSRENMAAEGPE
jgi:hypothetical protein